MKQPSWPSRMVREAAIVALRAAGTPMTASALVPHMPWRRYRRDATDCRRFPHHHVQHDHARTVECHITWHVYESLPFAAQVYQQLLALEKHELVRRTRPATGRRVFWQLTERGIAADEIAELRQLVDLGETEEYLALSSDPAAPTACLRENSDGLEVLPVSSQGLRETVRRSMDTYVEVARHLEQRAEQVLREARIDRIKAEEKRDQLRRRWSA